jgi:hypothetical protein
MLHRAAGGQEQQQERPDTFGAERANLPVLFHGNVDSRRGAIPIDGGPPSRAEVMTDYLSVP